jgi:hypothetical protein
MRDIRILKFPSPGGVPSVSEAGWVSDSGEQGSMEQRSKIKEHGARIVEKWDFYGQFKADKY